MPAISASKAPLVLVTGANGYIALHVVQSLLSAGYRVRGTVRSEAKSTHLIKTFDSYAKDGKFEVVIVEDITKAGAFDKALDGVDAVEHTASPFHTRFDDPQEAIGPAVDGTTSVLKSILSHGSNIKRVVVTSSCASVLHISPEPKVFSEKNWNEQAPAEVKEKGRDADVMQKYRTSKIFAEKAAWDLWNANKEKVGWDLVVLNPPFVFGPVLHEVSEPTSLNTSMQEFWNNVIAGKRDADFLNKTGNAWVDVRDLGLAHRLALEKPEAGGERLIICSGTFKWQDFVDAANAIQPAPYPSLPKGYPGKGSAAPDVVHMISYDTSLATKVLGLGSAELPYKTKEQVTQDCIKDFLEKGWKP